MLCVHCCSVLPVDEIDELFACEMDEKCLTQWFMCMPCYDDEKISSQYLARKSYWTHCLPCEEKLENEYQEEKKKLPTNNKKKTKHVKPLKPLEQDKNITSYDFVWSLK